MVKSGVKSTMAKDKLSITVWTYPTKSGYTNKLTKKTFHNNCPVCNTYKTLSLDKKYNNNGVIKCKCGAVYCGVSGYQLNNKKKAAKKLKPATVTANNTTKVASSQTQSQICGLKNATALTKARREIQTGTTYKGTLKIPILPNIKLGDLIQVDFDEFPELKGKTLYIDSIKEDIDNQTYTLELIEGTSHYNNKYNGKYFIYNKNGKIVKSSGSNPLQAKCKTVNVNIGLKDNSAIAKKIRLKGQKLGTIDKCYKWLRVKSAGGTGGWKYKSYSNHIISKEKYDKFGEKSAEKCWNTKKANCCDFAWIFSMLCKGAGKTVGIKSAKFTSLAGVSGGHMWNYKGSKNYDCSNSAIFTVDLKNVEKIKKDTDKTKTKKKK